MAGPTYHFRNDPLLRVGGGAISETVKLAATAYMDDYALELFALWYTGKTSGTVILDNPKWAEYMRADKGLHAQIDRQLIQFAEYRRDEFFRRSQAGTPALSSQSHRLQFHAEVGGHYGGYKTGYSVLHGSNQSVGDFQIQGVYSMAPGAPSKLNFTFLNNQMTFNDIVDANYRYKIDAVFANLSRNLGMATGAHPRDYILRIRWREPGPWTYSIPAAPTKPGAAPDWLQKYPNR